MNKKGVGIWTDDELQEAKRMWATNSAHVIAMHFGLTKNQVIGRLLRAGASPKRKVSATARLHPISAVPKRKVLVAKLPRFGVPSAKVELKEVREAPLPPACAPILFVERRERQCGWVVGPSDVARVMVCGAPKKFIQSTPYCDYHMAIATRGEG